MDIPTNLLTDFCRVTNADEELASQLLRDSGLDLEAAISSFFAIQDAGGLPNSDNNNSTDNHDDDNDMNIDSNDFADNSNSNPNPNPLDSVQDILRRQPRQPPATATAAAASSSSAPTPFYPQPQTYPQPSPSSPSSQRRRFQQQQTNGEHSSRIPPNTNTNMNTNTNTNTNTNYNTAMNDDPFLNNLESNNKLSALFTPPTHLISNKSFEVATSIGKSQKRWILISVYKKGEFASYEMIRDVWNDNAMQQLIESHFIFWHRDVIHAHDYTAFYNVGSPPHIAIIDPRSGERVRTWENNGDIIGKMELLDGLQDFISGNSFDSDRVIRGKSHNMNNSSKSKNNSENKHVPIPIDRTAEDAQLAAAIAASIEQNNENGDTDEVDQTKGSSSTGVTNHRHNGSSSNQYNDAIETPHSPDPITPLNQPNTNEHDVQVEDITEQVDDIAHQNRAASRLLSATDPTLNKSRSLRAEQDDAFEESLALDRAKAESERLENERIERIHKEEQQKKEDREALQQLKKDRLPKEPSRSIKENVVEIAIRLPNGKRIQRRFWIDNLIGDVCDFVEVETDDLLLDVEYELMSAYPKKSFADRSTNLQELAPRGALVVHLKN